ncbi:MAG: TolC family protein, partial [Acidiferrobacterales bacterium]
MRFPSIDTFLPVCLIPWLRATCGALSALIVLAGCTTVGPDYKKPSTEAEQQWMEVDDPRIDNEPAEHPEWWTVFNDPVLNKLIDMAREQNLTLRSAGIRVLEARAQLGIAVGSKYPQVQQFGGEASRINLSENQVDNVPLLEDGFSVYSLDFNLAWEIDFWGRFRRLIESAAANLEATVANYDAVMVALVAEVARSYVLIRTFEERIAIAE